MRRGEIYRTGERLPERGGKPGYYVIVSRNFVAANAELSTVVCAPIYSAFLGISTEIAVGPDEGLPHPSGIRCDMLASILKRKLTGFVSTLPHSKLAALDRALAIALDLPT